MNNLSSAILGGIVAVFALELIGSDDARPLATNLLTPARASFADRFPEQSVNRALKGDRIEPDANSRELVRPVASVEIIGLGNVAVVYRDRFGQILFHTDPLTNATLVARGIALPEVTIRDSNRSPTRPTPVERPRQPAPVVPMPVGCEPAISAMSDRALARVPSRCVSSVPEERKVAVVDERATRTDVN